MIPATFRRSRFAVVTGLALAATAALAALPIQDARKPAADKPAADKPAATKPAAVTPAAGTIDALAFLSGNWGGSDGASQWESWYSSAEGGQIVGASKELHDGRVVTIDFEHFYERDGALRMTPFPFGKRSVEFTLTALDVQAQQAVFENPEHDFPSKFTYRRVDAQHLRIVLEGQPGVPPGTLTLEFTRREP